MKKILFAVLICSFLLSSCKGAMKVARRLTKSPSKMITKKDALPVSEVRSSAPHQTKDEDLFVIDLRVQPDREEEEGSGW